MYTALHTFRTARSFFCLVHTLLGVCLLVCLTGCYELGEEVQLRADGSGRYQLLIDMSESRSALDLIMASVRQQAQENGEASPEDPFAEMANAFEQMATSLRSVSGVSAAEAIVNDTLYQFGVKFDFVVIEALNEGLTELYSHPTPYEYEPFYQRQPDSFSRSAIFYLRSITDEIQGEGQDPQLVKILNSGRYSFTLKSERAFDEAPDAAVELADDRRSLRLELPLTELQASEAPIPALRVGLGKP